MTLYEKIVSIYPELTMMDFVKSISLQNDGEGDYIALWQHPTLPEPTQEQLEAVMVVRPVPASSIRAWQGMLWLGTYGHLETVDAAVAQMAPPMQLLAKMCMAAPDTTWRIADGITQHIMGTVLGMSPEQIQNAFDEASSYQWPA